MYSSRDAQGTDTEEWSGAAGSLSCSFSPKANRLFTFFFSAVL